MNKKKGSRRKGIRYFRWSIKTAFLLFFILPGIGIFAGAPALAVYSFSNWELNQPLLKVPYGQSVCAIWLVAYGNAGPAAWLVCPVGGLQTLLTGRTDFGAELVIPTMLATIVFLVPILLFGNMFCGWACPVGTLIDAFDKGVDRYMPKVNKKRDERFQRSKEKEAAKHGVVCPTCPFARLLGNKHATVANGVLVSALVGSALFRFPVFCTICPIGITTRGMFHLKALTSITGRMMPIIIELSAIPIVAILLSLRERRYWCRKICPVGALLNIAGSFSPLIRPVVKQEKCVMKECPKTCEDYRLDYCYACRQIDQKRCERVCPQGINLLDQGALTKCTRCLECYVECDHDAVRIKAIGTPDAVSSLRNFKAKLKRKQKRD